jgi:hypothetical protein
MAPDPLIVTAEAQPVVQTTSAGAELPPPSLAQEQTADGLFGAEAQNAAAAIIGMHTGLVLLQHIIAEAKPPAEEAPPRKKPGDLEPAV